MKTHRRVTAKSIPDEVIDGVLLKLPAKCIARCRCVSKNWDSIIGRTYFKDLFLARSLSRPQLLFVCLKEGPVYFFSSPQPLRLADNSLLTADYQMKIPFYASVFDIRCSSVRGLILLSDRRSLQVNDHQPSVICNPSTGYSMTLPELKTRRVEEVNTYLGYDPIEKQHKVLSMNRVIYGSQKYSKEHHVLTLRTREPSWRMIECSIPHNPCPNYIHICINGILYYSAINMVSFAYMVVCFDVRSEKFSFINTNTSDPSYRCEPLINYNEKQEWSEYIYELPALWKNIVGDTILRLIGVTQSGEILLSPYFQDIPFYVFYFNTKTSTIRRVEIQGIEVFKNVYVYTFQDHFEDLKLLMR